MLKDVPGFKTTRQDATKAEGNDNEEDEKSVPNPEKCTARKDDDFSFAKLLNTVKNTVYVPISYIYGEKSDHRSPTKHQKRRRDRRATPRNSSDGIYRRDSKRSAANGVGGHETLRKRRGHGKEHESKCTESARSVSISSTLKLNCSRCRTLNEQDIDRLSIWRVAAEELYVGGRTVNDRKSVSRTVASVRKVVVVGRPLKNVATGLNDSAPGESSGRGSDETPRDARFWRKAASELYDMAQHSDNDTETKEMETTSGALYNGNDVDDNTSSNKHKNSSDNNSALKDRTVTHTGYSINGLENRIPLETKHTSNSKILSPDKSKSCIQLNKSNTKINKCNSNRTQRDEVRAPSYQKTPDNADTTKMSKPNKLDALDVIIGYSDKQNITRNKLELKSSSDQQVLQFYESYRRKTNKRIMNGKDGYRLKLHNMFSVDGADDGCGNFYYRNPGRELKRDDLMSKSENEISKLVNKCNDNLLRDYQLIIQPNNFIDGGRVKVDEEMRTQEVRYKTECGVESNRFKLNEEKSVYVKDDRAVLNEFSRRRNNPDEKYRVSLTCSPAFLKSYKRKEKNSDKDKNSKEGGQLYPNKEVPVFIRDESNAKCSTDDVRTSDDPPKECETDKKKEKEKKKSKKECKRPEEPKRQEEECKQSEDDSEVTSSTAAEPSPRPSVSSERDTRSSSSKQSKSCSRCKLPPPNCKCVKGRDRDRENSTKTTTTNATSDSASEKSRKCYHKKSSNASCSSAPRHEINTGSGIKISIGTKADSCSDNAKRLFCCCCQPDCSLKDSLKKMFCISLPSSTSSETRCYKKKDYSKTGTFFFKSKNNT